MAVTSDGTSWYSQNSCFRVSWLTPAVTSGKRVIIYIRVSDTTGREDTLISDETNHRDELRQMLARWPD